MERSVYFSCGGLHSVVFNQSTGTCISPIWEVLPGNGIYPWTCMDKEG